MSCLPSWPGMGLILSSVTRALVARIMRVQKGTEVSSRAAKHDLSYLQSMPLKDENHADRWRQSAVSLVKQNCRSGGEGR